MKKLMIVLAALMLTACSAQQASVVATPESGAIRELTSQTTDSAPSTPEPTAEQIGRASCRERV